MPADPFKFDGILSMEKAKFIMKYAKYSVLDVGCHNGNLVAFLASQSYACFGMDINEDLIISAKQSFPQLQFLVGSADNIPFHDKSFDTCICLDVIEHVTNDLHTLRELARIARHNIIIQVPREDEISLPSGVTYRHYIDPTHNRYYTLETWYQIVNDANLKVEHIELVGRIRPALAYSNIGISKRLCRMIDNFFWYMARDHSLFRSAIRCVLLPKDLSL